MSLDPRDSRRRGRSKSPGRRREDDDHRSHSKVRAPSPPTQTSKYAYDDEPPSRGKTYDYDDRSTRDAEPRTYYDPRGSDPRQGDPYYGRPEYGAPAGGYSQSSSRQDYAAPAPKSDYSMPGAFDPAGSEPAPASRYTTKTTSSRGKEKDYYKDLAYGEKPYEEKKYAEPQRDQYGRATSPLPESMRDWRYEEDNPKRAGKKIYDDSSEEDEPPRKSKSRYEDEEPPRKSKSRYEDDEPPRKSKSRYEDASPPKSSRYEEENPRRPSRYEDEDPRRGSKYQVEDEPPRKSKSRYEDDEPSRKSIAKYEDPTPPKSGRYDDEDKYKYGGSNSKDYDSKRYDDDRYRQDKYGKEDKYAREDKYVKSEGKYGKDERERGASFSVTAGQHSVSGNVNVSHGQEKSKYVRPPSPSDFAPPGAFGKPTVAYAEPKQWEYAKTDPTATYPKPAEKSTDVYNPSYAANTYPTDPRSRHGSTANYQPESGRSLGSQIVTVEPGMRNKRDASPAPGMTRGMHSLSVSTGHHGGASLSLATAPGSPLLESYHGTYQSISPMPSPLMIAQTAHSDALVIEALEPGSSSDDDDRRGKKKRTARFHDPKEEAAILAQALKGDKRAPDTEPLIEILPGLTHEQILDLRVEYKKIVKTGPERKGVNIAKHIKSRMKEEDPSLMKACYACALGKWESEAYWANFWYQGEKSRRELLIESLMGRTNREIQQIKDGFADKKYGDSLVKCMKTELREDKFKKAVLLVLEEKKMDERPAYGLDRDLIQDDVKDLYKAVRSEKGGESAMIAIIVVRSDGHLREVLRVYEATYRANFTREMLKRSGNLVGELLAHILNGVINKPVRDALLIKHALSLSKSDSIRTELLISRLVRYHWDRPHMEAVKREYRSRYGIDMQKAVREGTKGEWGQFCEMLCLRRMGDEVRRVDVY